MLSCFTTRKTQPLFSAIICLWILNLTANGQIMRWQNSLLFNERSHIEKLSKKLKQTKPVAPPERPKGWPEDLPWPPPVSPLSSFGSSQIIAMESRAGKTVKNISLFSVGQFDRFLAIPQEEPLKAESERDFFLSHTLTTENGFKNVWTRSINGQNGKIKIYDLAFDDRNTLFLSGEFAGQIKLANDITLKGKNEPLGFVALFDAESGKCIYAFPVEDVIPKEILSNCSESIVLTNQSGHIAYFSIKGKKQWAILEPQWTNSKLAYKKDKKRPAIYVASNLKRQPDSSELALLFLEDGSICWREPIQGTTSALGVDQNENALLAGMVQQKTQRTAFVTQVSPQAQIQWRTLVAKPEEKETSLVISDLAVDRQGNTHLAASIHGTFTIEYAQRKLNHEACTISVDRKGNVFGFKSSESDQISMGLVIASHDRNNIVLAGTSSAKKILFDQEKGSFVKRNTFLAQLCPLPFAEQKRYIIRYPKGYGKEELRLEELRKTIAQAESQVYIQLENQRAGIISASAFLTKEGVERLREEGLLLIEEMSLTPDRDHETSSFANASTSRLNKAAAARGVDQYQYPVTHTPTYLYLIDTEIDTSPSWLSGGSTRVEGVEEIHLIGSGTSSTSTTHGDDMLALVASPNFGSAPGTPIHIVNYDIYGNTVPGTEESIDNDGTPTSIISALETAITTAVDRHLDSQYTRKGASGVILIASSGKKTSSSAAEEAVLQLSIDYATSNGLIIVVSAGNSSATATDFLPAAFGQTDPGVVCVGGISSTGTLYASSNTGTAVNILASAEGVPVPGGRTFNGTSASAATLAGIALIHQSSNPFRSPDNIKLDLLHTDNLHAAMISGKPEVKMLKEGVSFKTTASEWAARFNIPTPADYLNLDPDNDGLKNIEEYYAHTDPTTKDKISQFIQCSHGSSGTLAISQPLPWYLVNESTDMTLTDGTTLSMEKSTTLSSFPTTLSGTTSHGTTSDVFTPLIMKTSTTSSGAKEFYRTKFTHTP